MGVARRGKRGGGRCHVRQNAACGSALSPVKCGVAQEDDRAIKEEGLDNLTEEELRSASRARGMRAPYGEGAVAFMRRQMTEWLDLSLNR